MADPEPVQAADTPRRNRRRDRSDVWPGGRRVLTLEQVADVLQVDVRIVRKLVKIWRDEQTAAEAAGRAPRRVGLEPLDVSDRAVRVTERALGEYLEGARNNRRH